MLPADLPCHYLLCGAAEPRREQDVKLPLQGLPRIPPETLQHADHVPAGLQLLLDGAGASRAMLGTAKQEKKAAKAVETCLMSAAVKLSKYIRMDEYKRSRMAG